jgi:hypothetical protein
MLSHRLMRFVCNGLRCNLACNRACPRLTLHLLVAEGDSSQREKRERRTNQAYKKRVCGGSAGLVRGCAPRYFVVHRFGGGSDAVCSMQYAWAYFLIWVSNLGKHFLTWVSIIRVLACVR